MAPDQAGLRPQLGDHRCKLEPVGREVLGGGVLFLLPPLQTHKRKGSGFGLGGRRVCWVPESTGQEDCSQVIRAFRTLGFKDV